MVRRFAILGVSLTLLLGLNGAHYLLAQGDAKKDEAKKDEVKKVTKEEAKKDEAKKDEAKKEETLLPIPPEVEKKLEAARRAVAEAIVAAQDAGLVKTSIDPPPILDILITGRATDESTLKAKTGVSPEVFGAWFTGYGKTAGIVPQNDVRITQPSAGLKTWYDQRASILNREIEAVRKANGTAAKPKDEAKKDEVKKDEAKKDEAKKDEAKKDEAKKDEAKKDEAKKDEEK
jgi:pentapeptide MXKDX repeat protein